MNNNDGAFSKDNLNYYNWTSEGKSDKIPKIWKWTENPFNE